MADLKVVIEELNALATSMESLPWFAPQVQVVPPDALQVAKDAAGNLNANASVLQSYQRWAEQENRNLAEMLRAAARAYENVDKKYRDRLDDPGKQTEIDAVSVPVPSTPMPPIPDGPPAFAPLNAGDYSDVNTTQQNLTNPDHGASLQVAEVHWAQSAASVDAHAQPQKAPNWEGEAAETAHGRISEFKAWLQELSAAWQRLSQAAIRVEASHKGALAEHTTIYARYKALEAQLAQGGLGNSAGMQVLISEMEELQRRSDEVRQDYANNATFDPVHLDKPRATSSPASPAPPALAGAGGGGVGGEQPTGDPAATAQRMSQSLGQPQSGPRAGGAQSGGGAPSGGGSPSGGSGSGGAPSGAPAGTPGGGPSTGSPKLPTDPSLRPAAASGGGGSGGGGAGLGASPMSPAVTAETVAPAPPIPVTTGAAPGAAGPGGAGAMAGGGMGMAPMHGAGAGQQGKEKRRDPRLAPDEDLYTEDRPWTEAVIGNRRRRDVQDGKEAK